ncbi:MAG TPA: DUF456 domain-containing protein [Prosthecobacter sp.]|nr:DUF456 domain-containing protein [Prosthecobacter sp.]
MLNWLTSAQGIGFIAEVPYAGTLIWLLTGTLLVVGVIGSIVPLLPGPVLIFIAGILHTLLRPESGMSWPGMVILFLWLVLAFGMDFLSGALGARWFGASRWGVAGVVVGGIVGLFFAPIGFIVGPLAGALAFEMFFAKKRLQPAVKSTWGTLLGTGVGLVLRFIISLAMVATVLIDTLWW